MRRKFMATLVALLGLVVILAGCKSESPKFTVFFETNGAGLIESVEVSEGEKVTKPQDPTKNGYTFSGWYSDSKFEDEWDFANDVVTKTITLYAKWQEEVSYKTISELISIGKKLEDGKTSDSRYYVEAKIESIDNPTYGQMTISDATGTMSVYGSYSADGELRYSEMEEKPYAKDKVVLYGTLKNFKGEVEISSGWIISFEKNQEEVDLTKYKDVSVAEARKTEVNSLLKVSGVVAKITYANGMIPNGFYLVDGTESIYIYDSQVAPQVEVGNKVTIAGEKDYWILDTEQSSAEKFGYKGCNQLANAILVENDKKTNEWSKNWIKEKTVKEIIDTPANEDFTTTINKVTGIVKKEVGKGFTNYYINDLDNKTGSYVYTQCSGSDFEWLDEFDGKICTIYLSVINAKSTSSACIKRFVPIAVEEDKDFKFDSKDAPQFVLDYYIKDLFIVTSYYANPKLVLPSAVTNDFLGFSNVELEYKSNNEAIYFEKADNNYIMNIVPQDNDDIEVEITVTAKLADVKATFITKIDILSLGRIETVSINEAIAAEVDTEVTLRGVVVSNLVNKTGFYLQDSTGMMAVTTTDDVMNMIHAGDEIIIKGKRDLWGSSNKTPYQICVSNSVLIANLYGDKTYSTADFDNTKTLKELSELTMDSKYTTGAFIIKGTVKLVETAHYSNIFIADGDTEMRLYSSSANQYNWLKQFAGQELTIEIALCNWNSKNEWTGCVIAVTDKAGNKTINDVFLAQK